MGAWINVPKWTPEGVKRTIKWLVEYDYPQEHADILTRLISDARMETVWVELRKRDRKTQEFLHTPKTPAERYKANPEAAQHALMGMTFFQAFMVARDKVAVATPREIASRRRKLLRKATTFNREAQESGLSVDDAAAFRRRQQLYRAAAAKLRTIDDPLTVERHRGDKHERAVQTLISCFFLDAVGKRLDHTAATLAAVALGKTKVSYQIGRLAINRK